MMYMRKAVFITVRADSSRLANKALINILGKPTIEMVILRSKLVKYTDDIIVCTSVRETDNTIIKIAQRCGVNYFRGNLEDKLERWQGAAHRFKVDYFVTMDGDDLLCDPELMELGFRQMEKKSLDFIEAPPGLICGSFTYGIKTTALDKVCEIKNTSDTEMMWVYFKDTNLFRTSYLKVNDRIFFDRNIRMTLDYEEDIQFFKVVFEHFKCANNDVPLREIVPFLRCNPEIVKINAFRRQDWSDNQKRKTRLVLKFQDKKITRQL